ncbi:MAG: YCF48-related protein [Bacteroidia bacterium]|nr:YCF48-related protein [Bacteroidia bacterium]
MTRAFFFLIGLFFLAAGCREKITPTWEIPQSPASDRLTSVFFHDAKNGFVAGGRRFDQNLIFHTADGGQTWERQMPAELFEKIVFNLAFRDALTGLAICFEGKVLRTFDGGNHWEIRQTEGWMPLRGIALVSDSVVVVVGGNGYDKGVIHRSEDFGYTWAVVDTPGYELRDVVFTDAQTGYACGYGTIIKTTDGGKTWAFTPAKNEFFTSLSFVDAQTGFAVGRTGTIVKTTDGGFTWEVLRNGNNPANPRHFYQKVRFWDSETGYIVGDKGLILKTSDAGHSWKKLEKETLENLHDLHLFDEGDGIVVGESGTILRFRE